MYTGEAEAAALDANLQEVLELAALYEQADLKAACEERSIEGLAVKSVVPLLICSHLHDMGKLKQACIELIKANAVEVMMSAQFADIIKSDQPLLWKELRTALGLPAEEEKEQQQQAKRARKG
jgi:hypothetical protein